MFSSLGSDFSVIVDVVYAYPKWRFSGKSAECFKDGFCSFVTYMIGNLGLVEHSQLLEDILGYDLICKYAFKVTF